MRRSREVRLGAPRAAFERVLAQVALEQTPYVTNLLSDRFRWPLDTCQQITTPTREFSKEIMQNNEHNLSLSGRF